MKILFELDIVWAMCGGNVRVSSHFGIVGLLFIVRGWTQILVLSRWFLLYVFPIGENNYQWKVYEFHSYKYVYIVISSCVDTQAEHIKTFFIEQYIEKNGHVIRIILKNYN